MGPYLDLLVFGIYMACVIVVGVLAARNEKKSDDYFLASRNLTWWIIGGSMVAANISTHHFIGMSGQGYEIGLAIASFEWMAAFALILFAKFFLPYYIKSRITTMPEFLERRFSSQVRLVYAIICLIGYTFIELAVVLYTGSLALNSIFGFPLVDGLLTLCLVGGGYAIYGGFKSVAYTDIIQVTVLIAGGLTVTLLGLHRVGVEMPAHGASIWGGLQTLFADSPQKFHMVRAWNDPDLPWIGVFFGGMWLANIFYWGCNQFITQRTLAARDIWHGQMGAVFAGFLKLLVPFLVVLPGIIAFRLYNPADGLDRASFVLQKADMAFPTLVKHLLPAGCTGLVMAGLMGCVMSHIASMLSASSSIVTFDIYRNYFRRDASNAELIRCGRWTSVVLLVVATVTGFFLRDINSIFIFIQKYWSLFYPTICALFLAGFFYPRASARGSLIVIIVGPVWASLLMIAESQHWIPVIPFLNRAILDFLLACVLLWIFRTREKELPAGAVIDRTFSPEVEAYMRTIPWYFSFRFWSSVLIVLIVCLYIRFF